MKVPREIDELMWAVAEQRDEATNAQFLDRYPEFAEELEKRIEMVTNLRGSRPSKSVEKFVPREQVRSFGPSRLAVAGVAVLVLASATFAAYAVVQFVNEKRSNEPIVQNQPEIIFNPPNFPAPETSGNGIDPGRETEQPTVIDEPSIGSSQVPFDPYMGRITIQSEDIQLAAALQDIAAKAGLTVIIAPGFEDKRIKISFVNQPAIEVINRLGASFKFTAFKQNKVEILIVPAASTDTPRDSTIPGTVGISPTTGGSGPERGDEGDF